MGRGEGVWCGEGIGYVVMGLFQKVPVYFSISFSLPPSFPHSITALPSGQVMGRETKEISCLMESSGQTADAPGWVCLVLRGLQTQHGVRVPSFKMEA